MQSARKKNLMAKNRANNILVEALAYCRDTEISIESRSEVNMASPNRIQSQAGTGIRVNREGKEGYAWSEGQLSDEALLKEAVLNSKTSKRLAGFSHKGLLDDMPQWQTLPLELSVNKMAGFIKSLDFMLPSLLPERQFQLNARILQHSLQLSSRAGERRATRTLHFITLHSPQPPTVTAGIFSTFPEHNVNDILCTLAWRTVHSREMVWPCEYCLPGVFTPQAAGKLMEDFAEDMLTSGTAPKELFPMDQSINIYDDGTLPGGFGTVPFDGEGQIKKKVPLVQNGRILHTLFDRTYARLNKKEPLGTAVRLWGMPPRGGYSNLTVDPGTMSLGEMCAEIDYGILLDRLTPVPSAYKEPGMFCRRCDIAFIVKEGLPVCRIPAFIVKGRYADIFGRDFMALGFERGVNGRTLMPPIAVNNLNFEEVQPIAGESRTDLPGLWW